MMQNVLFQLCFNHDISVTKPSHQNDDKLPVNGYSKSRHHYFTASRLLSRRSIGAPYTK